MIFESLIVIAFIVVCSALAYWTGYEKGVDDERLAQFRKRCLERAGAGEP